MTENEFKTDNSKQVANLLTGKTAYTLMLFEHFVSEYQKLAGDVNIHAAKTMVGIATPRKRIAWVTQFGKNFIHVVFPFTEPHEDNSCFQKIAQVPGDAHQFNHHLRIYLKEDVNDEVLKFMKLAYQEGQ